MNYQHVRAFCAIVSEGSFSRAAAGLHLTQPTVSAQIQALEKYLGARLFERSAQGIALTQAGQEFHPYAVQLLELGDRAREAMEQLQGLTRGRLEVGASSVPGHYILPRLLVRFKEYAPGVQVSLCIENSATVRAGVHEGRFELGVVGERVRDERLRFEPILEDELLAVVRPEHPLAGQENLALADLLAWPVVVREPGSGTRATLEQAMDRAGAPPEPLRVWMELGSTEAVKTAARAADVIAVLSRWTIVDELAAGLLRALTVVDLDLSRHFYLCSRAHGCLSCASERFCHLLRGGECDGPSSNGRPAVRAKVPAGA